MVINHQQFKPIINGLFLTLSCFLIVYFLIHLTDNIFIKIGISVFAIALDVFMQYVLGLGRACWSGQKFKALILFLCYAVYVLIYAIPSAVGFFAVEIAAQEQSYAQTETLDRANQKRLTQIDQTIDSLNRQLAAESDTGYGSRSQAIIAELKKQNAERQKLQKTFQNVSEKSANVPKNVFRSLEDVFGVPENIIKVLLFGISTAMLYLGLILTSWNVSPDDSSAATVPKAARESASAQEIITQPVTAQHTQEPEPDPDWEMIKFIEGLFDGIRRRLNGNQKISDLTGISPERCTVLRERLRELKINGQPAFTMAQGASVANFPKEVILSTIGAIDTNKPG
jgi:predicted secreted protein